MEFIINTENIRAYGDECIEIFREGLRRQQPLEELVTKAEKLMDKYNILAMFGSSKYKNCIDFVLSSINLYLPKVDYSDNLQLFTECMYTCHREISSLDEVKKNQIVTYYFDRTLFLHAGIIEKVEDDTIWVTAQQGDMNLFIHPIEKISSLYGNKFKIFEINAEKHRKYVEEIEAKD